MEQITNLSYWVIVLGFAFSITGDAAIFTVSKFHNKKLGFLNWAAFLAFTHGTFPALSFIIFIALASISTEVGIAVNIFGVVMISAVVYEMLCDAFATKPKFSLSGWIECQTGLHKRKAKHFTKVLAVSWDAFTLGPILIQFAKDENWNNYEVAMTFVIFAVVVGLSISAILGLSIWMRKKHFSDVGKLTKLNFYGNFFEISVISSFAVALLLGTFSTDSNILMSLLVSITIFTTVFAANKETLWKKATADAIEAIEDNSEQEPVEE